MTSNTESQPQDARIPIIFGVTGHRDIHPEDKLPIQEALKQRLNELLQQYPHSPFLLVSGLAEGSDRLVVEVALELGYGLVAALPMSQSEYEKDFDTTESVEHFRKLLSLATVCYVVKSTNGTETYDQSKRTTSRDEAYLALGRYIAKTAQIVIAL